jgi:uncharacterized protein YcbX
MHITSLHTYPIKGCRGHSVDRLILDRLGAVGDRRLMVVDALTSNFLSQREAPVLATIEPVLDGPMLSVMAAGQAALAVELDPHGPMREVTIWDDTVIAADQGDPAAAWFSDVIGRPCRLVHFGAAAQRRLDPQYTPRADAETAFSDGYPLLAVLEESLDDLNTRLVEPVPMARFRPNIVVAGAPAWSEDAWTALTIGDVTLDAVKPCARCVVPTTDQATGARHPDREPLRTLATFRTIKGLGAIFGQNLVARREGELHVGATVNGER